MRPFAYERPESTEQALLQLSVSARPLAGGTDLLTLMKADLLAPERLVNLKRLTDLPRGIRESPQGLEIGALTTLTEIERSPLIRERYAVLSEAAEVAATPQLRNMATIGGNLMQRPRCWYFRNSLFDCWLKGGETCFARDGENQQHALFSNSPCVAVHPSDPAPALLALDADVQLRSPAGERAVPLIDFFAQPDPQCRTETRIAPDEIITAVRIPTVQDALRSTYVKAMDRKTWEFALVSVAAAAVVERGLIVRASVAAGGVAPVPLRLNEVEQAVLCETPSEALFERAADLAIQSATPLGKNSYKVPLLQALVKRALARVCFCETAEDSVE